MRIHKKGWGYEDWLVNNSKYCGKILHFNKGKKCSIHYHKLKDETFIVLKGMVYLVLGKRGKTRVLYKGDIVRIKPYKWHRIHAISDSEILEISTHHINSDSYRIERGD